MKLIDNFVSFFVFSFCATACGAETNEEIRRQLDTQDRTIQRLTMELNFLQFSFRKLHARVENIEKNAFGPLYNEFTFVTEESLDVRLNRIERRLNKK